MTAFVDRSWRLIATAISFAAFGLGGLALALIYFPLLHLFIRRRENKERVAQHTVHAIWRLYIRMMVALGVLTYECHGEEVLRADRGAMVIANHPTLLDVVFLMSFMERTQCVVKAKVWSNPFMAGVVRATNYIPNLGDGEKLVAACAASLCAGNNVVLFPEGSRTTPGQPRRMTRGFAHAAVMAGAPVRLVTIECHPLTLRKGEPWYAVPPTRPHWTIRVHGLINIDPPQAKAANRAEDARRLCAEVDRRLGELVG